MNNEVATVLALAATTKRTEKEAILEAAWEHGLERVFEIFSICYDRQITFGVKKVPKAVHVKDPQEGKQTYEDFLALLDHLKNRRLTGNAMKSVLESWAASCDSLTWDTLYRPCLMRDMNCHVTDSTLNTVLDRIGTPEALKYKVKPSEDEDFTGVMLAGEFDEDKHMKGKVLVDVKLDGARFYTVLNKEKGTVTHYTRGGKTKSNFPHITNALLDFMEGLTESIVLDGEIMSEEGFQKMMRMFSTEDQPANRDTYLAVFDMIPLKEIKEKKVVEISQTERYKNLLKLEKALLKVSDGKIIIVKKHEFDLDTEKGKHDFAVFNQTALMMRYEGIMVKDPKGYYTADKRTKAWLKFKPFVSVTVKIVGYKPGKEGKYEHLFGSILCEGTDFDPIDKVAKKIKCAVSGMTDEMRNWIHNHRDECIGRLIEVYADSFTQEEDQEGTDEWSLRFCRMKWFRDTPENKGVKV